MDRRQYSELHQNRFSDLPLDCGASSPGVIDTEEWRDWSELHATADQLRIEDHLDRLGVARKAILHIGIGSSGLAKRFARQASRIVGTTIIPAEAEAGARAQLPNYSAVLHNKYSGKADIVPGRFDFIVDNNPTSFCCCFEHLGEMLRFYAEKLADDGQILTHRIGLGWHIEAPEAHERWSFDLEDLSAVASSVGLTAYQVDHDIYVLARTPPRTPSVATITTYYVRKAVRKLWRAATLRGKLLGR